MNHKRCALDLCEELFPLLLLFLNFLQTLTKNTFQIVKNTAVIHCESTK